MTDVCTMCTCMLHTALPTALEDLRNIAQKK